MDLGHVAAARNVTSINFPVLNLCRVCSYFLKTTLDRLDLIQSKKVSKNSTKVEFY